MPLCLDSILYLLRSQKLGSLFCHILGPNIEELQPMLRMQAMLGIKAVSKLDY